MVLRTFGRFGTPALAALALSCAPATAAAAPGDAAVAKLLPLGSTVETRVDGDVTGDGLADTIVVTVKDDDRRLIVLGAGPRGLARIGETAMDPSPLGSAQLRITKGVLIVEDLTGGTTAIASLYRWRFDPAVRKMRLIGDDVSLYSRTWMHDGLDVSSNRITGMRITTRQLLRGRGDKASYVPSKPVGKVISRDPIYMGDEPAPEKTLGMGL